MLKFGRSSSETAPTTKIPISKASPATPRVSKLGRGIAKSETDSPSPLPNVRSSVERLPRTVPSKPALDRRSPKTVSPAEVSSQLHIILALYISTTILVRVTIVLSALVFQ